MFLNELSGILPSFHSQTSALQTAYKTVNLQQIVSSPNPEPKTQRQTRSPSILAWGGLLQQISSPYFETGLTEDFYMLYLVENFNQIFKYSMAQNRSLYERLGGHDAIKSVVDKFYVYMLSDPRTKEFFKNTDMNKQRARQTDFISMATGGPNNYQGLGMKEAHKNMKIGHKQFDATWENLEKSLHDHKVDVALITEVREVFYSVEEQVIEVK